ncbi:MAG: 2-C-methyl-D-erythritol 2,4-cyclodiphosphate synthase [Clostridia bacterium]|nr:2-C-methyl-D-erythritol 2,4-cyclodiphosphate synthase [Clostridia bacterium]
MFRIGSGYDVHKLTENRKLIIGGVDIPYEKGLLGHSDADVLVHAIADAILGAAAMGDIGLHYPDTNNEFKDMDSLVMLGEIVDMINEKGFELCNLDATIIAQRPKMRPYIDQMRENIARVCKIDVSCVNVKATTEEGLGFTGSGDGIASNCICLLETR